MAPSTTLDAKHVIADALPDPAAAAAHFEARIAFETDAWDVHEDLQAGAKDLVVIDARRPRSYEEGHIPGALNLPYREIGPATLQRIPKDKLVVTYCSGYFCNASTKAAARLAALGYHVKELRDGLAGWVEEGYEVETGPGPQGRPRIQATA